MVRNHVYHPAFAGSFSLKDVLLALVPDMTCQGMEVADGTDAGLAWEFNNAQFSAHNFDTNSAPP